MANILCVQISYEYISQRQTLSQYFSFKNGMLSKHKMISAQLPLNALFCFPVCFTFCCFLWKQIVPAVKFLCPQTTGMFLKFYPLIGDANFHYLLVMNKNCSK